MPEALTFDIPISALLKGSRGIGKFTTAVQVARRLGMHVFEVSILWIVTLNVLMPTRRTATTFLERTTRSRKVYFVFALNKRLNVRPAYLLCDTWRPLRRLRSPQNLERVSGNVYVIILPC
jgi:hypothetical protein